MNAPAFSATFAEPTTETIEIASIVRDVQVRAKGTNREAVADYARDMEAGDVFPPVVLFRDKHGALHLADGAHRVDAALRIGAKTITAEIREGSKKDCLLYAVGSGRRHAVRFTNADKRRAVELMLAAYPNPKTMSDRKIADMIGVDHKTVGAARARLRPADGETPQAESGEFPQSESAQRRAPDPLERAQASFRRLWDSVAERDQERFRTLVLAVMQPEAKP